MCISSRASLQRQCVAIRLIVRDRVECVDDCEDPGRERDLRAAQTAGIAGSVPALVVARDHLAGEAAERRDGSNDPLAEPRVLANLVELRGRQRARASARSSSRRRSCRCRGAGTRSASCGSSSSSGAICSVSSSASWVTRAVCAAVSPKRPAAIVVKLEGARQCLDGRSDDIGPVRCTRSSGRLVAHPLSVTFKIPSAVPRAPNNPSIEGNGQDGG